MRSRVAVAGLFCAAIGAKASPPAVVSPRPLVTVAWSFTLAADRPASQASLDAVLAGARAAHTPVLIDFSADWCAACRLLDRSTYSAPEVVREARRFVTVRIDATNDDAATRELAARFGVIGMPTLVFVSSRGEVLGAPRVLGLVRPDVLVGELRKVD